jgi:hypothetical protein
MPANGSSLELTATHKPLYHSAVNRWSEHVDFHVTQLNPMQSSIWREPHQPNNPKEYLQQLSTLTGFTQEIKPKSLPSKDFEKLLITIQQLAGFTPENKQAFLLLPKITAKFYSTNRKIEFYLAGYVNLLTKPQAIEWVEAHKLDAVIVIKTMERSIFDQDLDTISIKSVLNKKNMGSSKSSRTL